MPRATRKSSNRPNHLPIPPVSDQLEAGKKRKMVTPCKVLLKKLKVEDEHDYMNLIIDESGGSQATSALPGQDEDVIQSAKQPQDESGGSQAASVLPGQDEDVIQSAKQPQDESVGSQAASVLPGQDGDVIQSAIPPQDKEETLMNSVQSSVNVGGRASVAPAQQTSKSEPHPLIQSANQPQDKEDYKETLMNSAQSSVNVGDRANAAPAQQTSKSEPHPRFVVKHISSPPGFRPILANNTLLTLPILVKIKTEHGEIILGSIIATNNGAQYRPISPPPILPVHLQNIYPINISLPPPPNNQLTTCSEPIIIQPNTTTEEPSTSQSPPPIIIQPGSIHSVNSTKEPSTNQPSTSQSPPPIIIQPGSIHSVNPTKEPSTNQPPTTQSPPPIIIQPGSIHSINQNSSDQAEKGSCGNPTNDPHPISALNYQSIRSPNTSTNIDKLIKLVDEVVPRTGTRDKQNDHDENEVNQVGVATNSGDQGENDVRMENDHDKNQETEDHNPNIPIDYTNKKGWEFVRFKPCTPSALKDGVLKAGELELEGRTFESLRILKRVFNIPRPGFPNRRITYVGIASLTLSRNTLVMAYQKMIGGIRTNNIQIHFKDYPIPGLGNENPFQDEGVVLGWDEFVKLVNLQEDVKPFIRQMIFDQRKGTNVDRKMRIYDRLSDKIYFKLVTPDYGLYPIDIRRQIIGPDGLLLNTTNGYRFTLMEWMRFVAVAKNFHDTLREYFAQYCV
jgi:hypothetical protein